ncbi:MAG: Hpt domain-containing protein [Campylobacterota bacterium]|nr:Hpt domain-containing protein [Campylobacterota bacterium]
MLFYNSRKEFVGIDEEDLNALGFSNLSELRSESADFADLFVRTPGFIHNFKYVHWIDYITYGGSTEMPKAIIHTKTKNFWCNITISTSYMVDNPATPAYIIQLQNLRELSKQETVAMTNDILVKPTPESVKEVSAPYIDQSVHDNIKKSIVEQNNSYHVVDETYSSEVTKKSPIKKTVAPKPTNIPKIETKVEEKIAPEPTQVTEITESVEESDDLTGYVYDPQVASDELGLPVDLIEEFIEDFIAQAKEFKDDLYAYAEDEDINNVRILSHKLKGVAANLRVEDAFEVLATINTTTDLNVINTNLTTLYKIIAKLNGEEVDLSIPQAVEPAKEDEFILDFKDMEHSQDIEDTTPSKKPDPIENDDDLLDINNLLEEKEEIKEIEEIEEDLLNIKTQEEPVTYDKDTAMKEMGLSPENFEEFFSDYLTDADELCNIIKEAVAFDDAQLWNNEVIKLKGMSENMRVELFATELETLLHTQEQNVALDAINKIISIISTMKD